MKVLKQKDTRFKPVTLTVTLESQEEFDAFVALMSFERSVTNMLRSLGISEYLAEIASSQMTQIYLELN